MLTDPRELYRFEIEGVHLVGEERIDPHEEEAILEVVVGLHHDDYDGAWVVEAANLVVAASELPESVSIRGREDDGWGIVRLPLDVEELLGDSQTAVRLIVVTGTFAGADGAAPSGDYVVPAAVEAVYSLRGPVESESEVGPITITVAAD